MSAALYWRRKAGYASSGLLDFLRALSQAQAKPENQRAFGQLLSTHPPLFSRRSA